VKEYFSFSNHVFVSVLCIMLGGSFTPKKEGFFGLKDLGLSFPFVLLAVIKGVILSFTLFLFICLCKGTWFVKCRMLGTKRRKKRIDIIVA